TLETDIFLSKKKLAASFSIPTSTEELRILANSTEKTFAHLNKIESNTAQAIYYFYRYLRAFMLAAKDNDGLVGLSKKEALEKMIKTTNDIHTLARIITYFKLEMEFKISLKQIRFNYNQFYYPEAEDFLIKHLKISIPEQCEDSLFIQIPNTSTPQEVD